VKGKVLYNIGVLICTNMFRRGSSAISKSSILRLVFAHYMLITRPPNGDYTNDMKLARSAGIDAFAINYGGWNVNFPQQEGYLKDFYSAAEKQGFKVFLSIDCTSVTDSNMVVRLVNQYAKSPAQFKIDGKLVLSTFQTNNPAWNWQTDVLKKINSPVFFIPGTLSDDASQVFSQTPGDGFFPWIHPTKTAQQEAQTDKSYAAHRDTSGKRWMAAIAPWFFKRFSSDQNWSHAQDDAIFIDRWQHLLQLKPDLIEIVTWNDWGESSYVGPADTTNISPSSYWDSLNHSAFLKMTSIFIKAYKAGQTSVTVKPADEDVFFFYRLQPASTLGSSDKLPLPLDAKYLKDDVFVVSFLASKASITLTTGGKAHQIAGVVGVKKTAVPWTLGKQSLSAQRNGKSFVHKKGPSISRQLKQYNGNVVVI
jgi:glucan endo-1,3-alpha-glucosidase